MSEVWAPVLGYEGDYEVSSYGHVRSNIKGYGLLKLQAQSEGYVSVRLRRKQFLVHRLVALAFLPCPGDSDVLDVAHLNGHRTDNRLENLTWATRKENLGHRRIHGTDEIGERNPMAKLTYANVAHILASRAPSQALAEQFGVSCSTVNRVRSGATWAA